MARPGRRCATVPHRSGTGIWPGSGWWGSIDGLCVLCADRFRPSELPSDRQALSQRTPGATLSAAVPHRSGTGTGPGSGWLGSIDALCVLCADPFRPSELPSDRRALSQRTPGAALCRGAAPPRHGHRARQRVVGSDRCALCALC